MGWWCLVFPLCRSSTTTGLQLPPPSILMQFWLVAIKHKERLSQWVPISALLNWSSRKLHISNKQNKQTKQTTKHTPDVTHFCFELKNLCLWENTYKGIQWLDTLLFFLLPIYSQMRKNHDQQTKKRRSPMVGFQLADSTQIPLLVSCFSKIVVRERALLMVVSWLFPSNVPKWWLVTCDLWLAVRVKETRFNFVVKLG